MSEYVGMNNIDQTLRALDLPSARDARAVARGRGIGRLTAKGSANAKLARETTYSVVSLNLAPAYTRGIDTCPASTLACRAACIGYHAGRNRTTPARRAKVARTKLLAEEPDIFCALLLAELLAAQKLADTRQQALAVRLNCYSDVAFEKLFPELFSLLDRTQFYDYTKRTDRWSIPPNYHLTYSFGGGAASFLQSGISLREGRNVAAVCESRLAAEAFARVIGADRVIEGDYSDLRFLDPPGCLVYLKPKGNLRSRHADLSNNPFVVTIKYTL